MRNPETTASRRLQWALFATFLATLIWVPAARHLLPSGQESGPRAGAFAELFANGEVAPASGLLAANLRLQERIESFEGRLEETSPLRALTLPRVQLLLAKLGGVGNETVYLGREGWLFLRQGFDYLTGPAFLDPKVLERRRRAAPAWRPTPHPDPRPAILDFHRQLAERGIRLMLLPAPTKAMLHPEALATGLDASEGLQNPSFQAFASEMKAARIEIFDPTPLLLQLRESGGEAFLRTDSHWSPEAVDTVARHLAERLRAMDLPCEARRSAGAGRPPLSPASATWSEP